MQCGIWERSELRKVLDRLRDHVVVVILAALVASGTAYFKGVFDKIIGDVLPKGAEISCVAQNWLEEHWPSRQPEATPETFRLLIATLNGDDASGTLTQAVVRAFQGQKAVDAVSTCGVLKIVGGGPTAEVSAAKTGLEWLARGNADVLVFGEVLPKGDALNLQFLSPWAAVDFTAKSFRLESGLLRDEFKEAAAAQLQAVALASVRPVTEEQGTYLVKTLWPVVQRLRRISESPPPGMSSSGIADVQFALGQALSVIGDQSGENGALQDAVAAYREALKERTRERVPLDWATTQNSLGNALARLGERESGTARLERRSPPIARR